jgi:hypothetical protein
MTHHENHGDDDARSFFDNLLTAEFRFRRVSGVVNKSEFLKGLPVAAKTMRRSVGPEEDVRVLADGEMALVWLTIIGDPVEDPGSGQPAGSPQTRTFRNVRIFRRRRPDDQDEGLDGWLLDMWHNTETTGA